MAIILILEIPRSDLISGNVTAARYIGDLSVLSCLPTVSMHFSTMVTVIFVARVLSPCTKRAHPIGSCNTCECVDQASIHTNGACPQLLPNPCTRVQNVIPIILRSQSIPARAAYPRLRVASKARSSKEHHATTKPPWMTNLGCATLQPKIECWESAALL